MARTDKFRKEHGELLTLANELQALLNVEALSRDGSAARSCLGKLLGKLMLHLAAEDKVLYPELVGSKDPVLAGLAKQFSIEMKSTDAQVAEYSERWPTPSSIKASPAEFIKETKQVVSIITNRIKREDQELYAAADSIEGKSFS